MGVERSKALSANMTAPWSMSLMRSQTTLGSFKGTRSVTRVYSASPCQYSTARCELRNRVKSSGCGGDVGSVALVLSDNGGEETGLDVDADCERSADSGGREGSVNRSG